MLDRFIEYYYLVPLSSVLIAIIMYGFNYWNVTNLEKKLMTNFKRVQILFAAIFLESIFIGLVFYILLLISKDEIYSNSNLNYSFTSLLIQAFIIAFGLVFLINLVMLVSAKFLVPSFDYYLEKGESEDKWYLVRISSKNQVLMTNRDGKYVFQEGWQGDIFFQEMVELKGIRKFIFETEHRTEKIGGILFVFSIILYFVANWNDNLIFYIISTISLFVAIVLEITKKMVFSN
ncbi:MAG: hypothetical protein ABS939_20020 [Psychrobacillus sp.]